MKSLLLRYAAITLTCLAIVGLCSTAAVRADEGMWTFDNFPSKKVGQTYGFEPPKAWLDHVRSSSLRIAGGCSASFVSPQGLVMTNHHCVLGCVQQLSTPTQNYVQDGFISKDGATEKTCPAFELDQLTQITDVTSTVNAATTGKTGAEANRALDAAEATLQQSCGTDKSVRCDVVSLYHGGVYDLYRYHRYNDVRLVFAPEYGVAQFGGDPDNFNFPRFDFDIGLLRAYENGKPVSSPDYLHWSKNGSKPGDLVFVSGNPGQTQRQLTTAQLAYLRDRSYPRLMPALAELIGLTEEFMTTGPQQEREGHETLFYVQNEFKADIGRQAALLDPAFFGKKVSDEQDLRTKVAANPALASADGTAWDDIASLQTLRGQLANRDSEVRNLAAPYGLLGQAFELVRAASERKKPNADRLPEYTDQRLVNLQEQLEAPVPVFKDYEEMSLRFQLTLLRQDLGTDDPFTRKVLGTASPAQLAHALVSGTHLDDPAVRKALYDGGSAAIAKSDDPMIRLAVKLDPDARAFRKDVETRIDAPTRSAAERIARARFAIYGTSVDPDATFTARLSYGAVKGFENAQGTDVPPYTTIGGLFNRATGNDPYVLPQSWLAAKGSLDLATPMNVSTTNDIIGGNSGSPLIDRNANVVGLIFDGNIYSLGGDYGYEASRNRAVAVDSRALLAGLSKVYHLDRIVTEIGSAR